MFKHAGISRQFRIVRDNRVNQNAKEDVKQETLHQTSSYIHEKRCAYLIFCYCSELIIFTSSSESIAIISGTVICHIILLDWLKDLRRCNKVK